MNNQIVNQTLEILQETIKKDGYKKGIKSTMTWKILGVAIQTLLDADFTQKEILMLLVPLYEAIAGEYR